jgi:hypothetical protein
MDDLPKFYTVIRQAEEMLSRSLNGVCKITVHRNLDEKTIKTVRSIDNEKFREELRYSCDELTERAKVKGFFCVIAYLDGEPIGLDFGYRDHQDKVFFSDDTATLIEGKRIGTVLFALEIIHSYYEGYAETKLSTEEYDDKGRPLKQIWAKMGFNVTSEEPDGNIEMTLQLSESNVRSLYEKYIKPKKD